MRNFAAYKFPIFIAILLLVFSTIVGSQQLIKNAEQTKPVVKESSVESAESNEVTAEIKEGEAKAEVKVNNESGVNSNQNGQGSTGTCKVTRNGVTEIVPADQVNVNEKSSGDITVKVECDSTLNQSNGSSSNNTSIKNKIDVNVSSFP
jgi:hypothetical protein